MMGGSKNVKSISVTEASGWMACFYDEGDEGSHFHAKVMVWVAVSDDTGWYVNGVCDSGACEEHGNFVGYVREVHVCKHCNEMTGV